MRLFPASVPHVPVPVGPSDCDGRDGRWRSWALLGLSLACAVYLVPIFPHYPSANEISRWVLVAGLVEKGTAESSWANPLIGPLVDAARVGNSFYPNKAPGLALLSAPGYLLVRPLLGPPRSENVRWSLYAMRLVGATLPLGLLGLLVLRRTKGDPLALGTLLLATPMLVYGTLLFSHVAATVCVYASYLLLFRDRGSALELGSCVSAGALCGLATLTEYPAAAMTAVLALGVLASRERWQRLTAFVVGGAPFAALLALYNFALFDSPFVLSSSHEASAVTASLASRGVFGIGWPTLDTSWWILLSPARGLLFFSPLLVLALWAVVPRRGAETSQWIRLAIVASTLLIAMGYGGNHGGWCVGARYALTAVPFLVEAAWERGVRPGATVAALFTASVVLCVSPLLTFPFPAPQFPWVHAQFVRPLLAEGFVTPTLGSWLATGPWSIVPVVVMVLAAVPIALGWSRRVGAGALAGLVIAGAAFVVPVHDAPLHGLFRAVLLETHFVPGGRLAVLASSGVSPTTAREAAAMEEVVRATRVLAPDDWPYRRSGQGASGR